MTDNIISFPDKKQDNINDINSLLLDASNASTGLIKVSKLLLERGENQHALSIAELTVRLTYLCQLIIRDLNK